VGSKNRVVHLFLKACLILVGNQTEGKFIATHVGV